MQNTLSAFLQYAGTTQRRVFYPSPADDVNYSVAAVLVAFVPNGDDYAVLLTVRNGNLTHHAGQIAFAGGKRDTDDGDDIATALREAHEELGIVPETWQVFGTLPPLALPTGYRVTPVLAVADRLPEVRPQADEVAAVFCVPCALALDKQAYVFEYHANRGYQLPVLYWQNARIWGATAMVLYQLALHYQYFIQSNR